ncbi:hypothetical protein OGAPHI_002822 [Ogataea philodendri]|uniref:5'-3' DNA helicase ZGRF1-like N-terminal domain-containing protein n=1 Tax=Ogataea philodendri TaxID=1378263 RepID=A0A9P8T5N2_9ASCO|nr:uncharacterized protein OGAPHI_002822 [Ogataea philodendri]KAH3667173.1 hypothetical protein OGAPHI_002822 [Ogataea philodendri]
MFFASVAKKIKSYLRPVSSYDPALVSMKTQVPPSYSHLEHSEYSEYQILYTNETTKKHKVWHDGTMRLFKLNKKLIVYDEDRIEVYSDFLNSYPRYSVDDLVKFESIWVMIDGVLKVYERDVSKQMQNLNANDLNIRAHEKRPHKAQTQPMPEPPRKNKRVLGLMRTKPCSLPTQPLGRKRRFHDYGIQKRSKPDNYIQRAIEKFTQTDTSFGIPESQRSDTLSLASDATLALVSPLTSHKLQSAISVSSSSMSTHPIRSSNTSLSSHSGYTPATRQRSLRINRNSQESVVVEKPMVFSRFNFTGSSALSSGSIRDASPLFEYEQSTKEPLRNYRTPTPCDIPFSIFDTMGGNH